MESWGRVGGRDGLKPHRSLLTIALVWLQKPSFKGFHGLVAHVEPYKFMAYGRVARLNDTSLEITELPVRCWTQTYKENVLEVMLHGTEKEAPFIR